MESSLISKYSVTPLKRIPNEKGDIFHALKCSESSFSSFGEAYFSSVHKDQLKGWKKHTEMQLNLIVPLGTIRFYLYDEISAQSKIIEIGQEYYARLTIQPHIWVAFEGLSEENMLLNIASIEHNPNEAVNAPLEKFIHIFK